MKQELQQPVRGIIPPVVTPLTEARQLDVAGLQRLIEHLIAGGVHGLFLLGTTGEGPSLSGEIRRGVIRQACQIVERRLPIFVGISDSSLAASLELACYAAEEGCDVVVATPPFFYPLPQSHLLDYFEQLLKDTPLPMMLYNMPAVAGTSIDSDTVRQLVWHESIVGLKDSSGDIDQFKSYVDAASERPDFALLVGPERLLKSAIELGGVGGVSGGANVWPRVFVRLFEAAMDGNQEMAIELSRDVERFGEIYRVGPESIPGFISRTKSALSILGICDDVTAPPIMRTSDAEKSQINKILQQLGVTPPSSTGRVSGRTGLPA